MACQRRPARSTSFSFLLQSPLLVLTPVALRRSARRRGRVGRRRDELTGM